MGVIDETTEWERVVNRSEMRGNSSGNKLTRERCPGTTGEMETPRGIGGGGVGGGSEGRGVDRGL